MSDEEYNAFHHNSMVCKKTFEVKEDITEEQREKILNDYEAIRNGEVAEIR